MLLPMRTAWLSPGEAGRCKPVRRGQPQEPRSPPSGSSEDLGAGRGRRRQTNLVAARKADRGRQRRAEGAGASRDSPRDAALRIRDRPRRPPQRTDHAIVRHRDYWHNEFRAYLHFHPGVLNHQIVCFLRIAEAAALGRLVVGRKGKETRFELDGEEAATFLRAAGAARTDRGDEAARAPTGFTFPIYRSRRVFITCRAGAKILEQVKELITFGQFQPIVFRQDETAAVPLLGCLMEQMRGCDTAIVEVDTNVLPREAEPRIQANALIEIGAAMALYGRNFVLLVEDSVVLPSNLQGLRECRYRGDELNIPGMMEFLRAFSGSTRPAGEGALPTIGHVIAQGLPKYGRADRSAVSRN
jgi:Predicted nucleotide-binding protein containing TIR-like domain